jgi:hypothetical protein
VRSSKRRPGGPIAIAILSSMISLSGTSPSLQDEIKQVGHVFFVLFLVCTLMVIVGVVLEEIEWRGRESYVDTETGIFSPERRRTFAKLGLWLLVIGIAGEGFFEMGRSWTDGLLQDVSNTLLLNAEAQTGNAAKSARVAHDEADVVKEEAAAIRTRLNLASTQLRAMEPRWQLLEENKHEFIAALKPFAGQRYVVQYCGNFGSIPPEQFRLAQDFMNFMGLPNTPNPGARWVMNNGNNEWRSCTSGASDVGGNLVIVSSTAGVRVKEAANTLWDVLNKMHITTIHTEAQPDSRALATQFLGADSPWAVATNDPAAVILLVGTNPVSDLGQRPKYHK